MSTTKQDQERMYIYIYCTLIFFWYIVGWIFVFYEGLKLKVKHLDEWPMNCDPYPSGISWEERSNEKT